MRVTHVVATIDEPNAGPSNSVSHLCRSMVRLGHKADVDMVAGWRAGPAQAAADLAVHRHRQDFASAPVLGRLCLSHDLSADLRLRAPFLDIIHAHGLWLMPNVYPMWAAAGTNAAVVISPRGMLGGAALKFSASRKALFWQLLQRRAVTRAACLHATGEAEYEEIRAFGIDRPVAVIPNGVDLPEPAPATPAGAPSTSRTVLTLGRIHPKKGLIHLVRAWGAIAADHPAWKLRIVGPSELGHADELRGLALSLGLNSVSIEDALHGADKTAAYRAADLFVLPTLNDNFALTVAEALAAGTPVIATKGAPWSGLTEQRCGWWVDVGAEPLAEALRTAMCLPRPALAEMGQRGRAWMAQAFSWDRVARDMVRVYGWLKGEIEPPAFVRVD